MMERELERALLARSFGISKHSLDRVPNIQDCAEKLERYECVFNVETQISGQSVGPFDDEVSRQFYEDYPNVLDVVPALKTHRVPSQKRVTALSQGRKRALHNYLSALPL